MIFTGERQNQPEWLSLKGDFFGGRDVGVDARVKVIYDGRPGAISHQYVTFAKIANPVLAKGVSVADVADCLGLAASDISILSQP